MTIIEFTTYGVIAILGFLSISMFMRLSRLKKASIDDAARFQNTLNDKQVVIQELQERVELVHEKPSNGNAKKSIRKKTSDGVNQKTQSKNNQKTVKAKKIVSR